MICPILYNLLENGECVGEKCAWWIERKNQNSEVYATEYECAICKIARKPA